MNKSELKKFAATFRSALSQAFKQQLQALSLDDSTTLPSNPTPDYAALARALRALTPAHILETATYTWFNRLVALRFMELRGLLPPEAPSPWDSRDHLLRSTHQLATQLPQIFADPAYLDLFLPEDAALVPLLQPLLTLTPQNFQSIETIGWLYQYYQQSSRRSQSRRSYAKSEVPAATQLFTPDWVVKFLVENSLGRWWLDHGGDPALAQNWSFLVPRSNPPSARTTSPTHETSSLHPTPPPDPTTIKIFDPCCGSGHILVYAFTVLEQIYRAAGFAAQDIPELILRHNLYGLDLDPRAATLATLAVLLRARLSDPTILHRPIAQTWCCHSFPDPAVFPRSLLDTPPTVALQDQAHALFGHFTLGQDLGSLLLPAATNFSDLAQYLGPAHPAPAGPGGPPAPANPTPAPPVTQPATSPAKPLAPPLSTYLSPYLAVHQLLSDHYDFVITNPPYLRSTLMNQPLKNYLKDNFTDFKADTFAAFIYRSTLWLKPQGCLALMTPSNWLHATTFQPLRQFILKRLQLNTLVQPAPGSFFSEAAVDVCASVFQLPATPATSAPPTSARPNSSATTFLRLTTKTSMPEQGRLLQRYLHDLSTQSSASAVSDPSATEPATPLPPAPLSSALPTTPLTSPTTDPPAVLQYQRPLFDFASLPGQPFLYQLSPRALQLLRTAPKLADYAPPCQGIITGDNHRYLRYWFEPDPSTLSTKWLPHNKGGDYRKWYGNREFVIDWDAQISTAKSGSTPSIAAQKPAASRRRSRLANLGKNFQPSLSWSAITSGDLSVRFYDERFTFNSAAPSCFPSADQRLYLLGLLNSVVAQFFARALNPSLNLNPGDLAKLPVIIDEAIRPQVESLVQANLNLAQADYDEQETSPDFTVHPLLRLAQPDQTKLAQTTPTSQPDQAVSDAQSDQTAPAPSAAPSALTASGSFTSNSLADLCAAYQKLCRNRQSQLQTNETTLNQLFLTSFHLTAELNPQVQLSTLSLQVPTISAIIRTFLSYVVGCALGRFQPPTPHPLRSPVPPSLQPFAPLPPSSLSAPRPPLQTIPDLLSYLNTFLSTYFGAGNLSANLNFIADQLDRAYHEPAPTAIARYLAKQFFTDHARTYHHYPIYWQFTSGRAHAFDAFLYAHRYRPTNLTPADPSTKTSTLSALQSLVASAQTSPITTCRTPARRARIQQELQAYTAALAPLAADPPRLNFNLGVTANYARLQPLLAKLPRRRNP